MSERKLYAVRMAVQPDQWYNFRTGVAQSDRTLDCVTENAVVAHRVAKMLNARVQTYLERLVAEEEAVDLQTLGAREGGVGNG